MNITTYKRKVAIFNAYLGGHNLEYLHHLYLNAINDADIEFTFIVPDYFEDVKSTREWPERTNVKFYFFKFEAHEYLEISKSPLKKSWVLSKILKKTLDETGLSEAILIETIAFMPLLPFIIRRGTKITSIVYYIPKYHNYSKSIKKIVDKFNFWLLAKCKHFKKVCLLNAYGDAEEYNKVYKTTHFSFLPDPFNPIEVTKSRENIRKEHGINNSDILFIHFGSMTKRKGTIDILEAIASLKKEELVKKSFIFAGKVNNSIKNEFYQLVNNLKDKANLIIYDKFCEYELFGEICKAADYIIIPYKNISQSSGVCTYAAQFRTPVLGPTEGLLGEIIRNNGIGIAKPNLTPKTIAAFIADPSEADANLDNDKCSQYLKISTPKKFYNILVH